MKKKDQPITYDKFIESIFELYDAFKEVLKKGSHAQKRIAIQEFNTLTQIVTERVEDYRFLHPVNSIQIFKAVKQVAPELNEAFDSLKERFMTARDEITTLVEKSGVELKKPKSKIHRKRKMENRIKTKE